MANAAFVACMEDVLDVCCRPYDARFPVVCDATSRQLIGEVRQPIALKPGKAARHEHESVRNGVAQIFLAVEPLSGRRHVEVSERRRRQDWARWIRAMLVTRYPEAERVVLIMDNLDTHGIASLYETFSPREARELAKRLEIHYTPEHGSWLNMAGIELSVSSAQCLDRRLADMATMQDAIAAWQRDRNNRQGRIDWQFTTADARIRLKRLYPTF